MAVQGHENGQFMMRRHAQTVIFRADASLDIGTGHVMRCLTLADALTLQGAKCGFICADVPGNLAAVIRARGHDVHLLPAPATEKPAATIYGTHDGWLATSWQDDAQRVQEVLTGNRPDWLILDHYALDRRWERTLRSFCGKLLVIDDLADRPHECDLLLDQSPGRRIADYDGLAGGPCRLVVGPAYALLRPEFKALRTVSLKRRVSASLGRLLVTMGGVDAPNATATALNILKNTSLPGELRIDVAMNAQAPWLELVRALARAMPWPTEVHVNPPSMAKLMADSDLAIGAAGTTALERCCLGLPTLQVVLATNQEKGAYALSQAGAALTLGQACDVPGRLPELFAKAMEHGKLAEMSLAARAVCDGEGTARVINAMVSTA